MCCVMEVKNRISRQKCLFPSKHTRGKVVSNTSILFMKNNCEWHLIIYDMHDEDDEVRMFAL
jgi:hypothetical protein